MTHRTDVAVLGAGPAGASTALALAPHHHVTLIGHRPKRPIRPGETLAAASRRILAEMGLWDAFTAGPHTPCHQQHSRWGSDVLQVRGALRDLDGPAWLVDRPHLEHLISAAARTRGAHLITGRASVTGRGPHGWHVKVTGPHPAELTADIIIDATGRTRSLRRVVDTNVILSDRLACAWAILTTHDASSPTTYVESARDGWWYTTSLGGGHRLLAFHTDRVNPRRPLTARELRAHAAESTTLQELLHDTQPDPDTPAHWCTANSGRLHTIAGHRWLAVGDSAMTFDPLSSQGLYHALYDGWTSPTVIDRMLRSGPDTTPPAHDCPERIWMAYQTAIRSYYAAETRWLEQPFWHRRHHATTQPTTQWDEPYGPA